MLHLIPSPACQGDLSKLQHMAEGHITVPHHMAQWSTMNIKVWLWEHRLCVHLLSDSHQDVNPHQLQRLHPSALSCLPQNGKQPWNNDYNYSSVGLKSSRERQPSSSWHSQYNRSQQMAQGKSVELDVNILMCPWQSFSILTVPCQKFGLLPMPASQPRRASSSAVHEGPHKIHLLLGVFMTSHWKKDMFLFCFI